MCSSDLSRVLQTHCDALGRDPASIARSAVALVFFTDDEAEVRRRNTEPQPRQTIAGNASQLQDTLGAYADAGVDEFIFPDFNLPRGQAAEKFELMERFITEVASKL